MIIINLGTPKIYPLLYQLLLTTPAKKWLNYLKQYQLLGKAQLVRNNTSIVITNLTPRLQQFCSVINWKIEPEIAIIQQYKQFFGII